MFGFHETLHDFVSAPTLPRSPVEINPRRRTSGGRKVAEVAAPAGPRPGPAATAASGCGDFGDDAVTLARAAAWQRENPELRLRGRPSSSTLGGPGAVKKETLLALELSPDYRHECGICYRNYMLRCGCPCCINAVGTR